MHYADHGEIQMNRVQYLPRSAQHQHPHLPAAEAAGPADIWHALHNSAAAAAQREPLLRGRLQHAVLGRKEPADMLAAVLARRLARDDILEDGLREELAAVFHGEPALMEQVTADLAAVVHRDPACPDYLHVLLNLKGFHALQAHRAAHALWRAGRMDLAFTLSSLASMALAVDIHPAARIGCGVMMDHGTGVVIGETTVIEDNVSILQNVTLGGTGKEHGDRHPKIRSGVMLGAGAKVLGNIVIGTMSKVAAGSVVLREVPPHCTVAGVPARIVREHQEGACPSEEMDQMI